jgi:cobalt-zinc-cadmium efflux system protein
MGKRMGHTHEHGRSHSVPPDLNVDALRTFLRGLPGVARVDDLHIWPISTTETALTCHVVMPLGHPGDQFFVDAAHELAHEFKIGHTTIQIEVSEDTPCALAADEVV